MGQTLSEPITSKESAALQNSMVRTEEQHALKIDNQLVLNLISISQVKVGSSSMQGWRISMEDAHTHILSLNEDPDAMFFGGAYR